MSLAPRDLSYYVRPLGHKPDLVRCGMHPSPVSFTPAGIRLVRARPWTIDPPPGRGAPGVMAHGLSHRLSVCALLLTSVRGEGFWSFCKRLRLSLHFLSPSSSNLPKHPNTEREFLSLSLVFISPFDYPGVPKPSLPVSSPFSIPS